MDDYPIVKMPCKGYRLPMRSKHISAVEWYNLIEIIRGISTCTYGEAIECVEGIKDILKMDAPRAREPLDS